MTFALLLFWCTIFTWCLFYHWVLLLTHVICELANVVSREHSNFVLIVVDPVTQVVVIFTFLIL
jgi:TM2 domain-containing membrane protein YozV